MSDHEWEGIGLYQAIINIIAASTSAALGVLKLTGGTMSGAIAMGSQKITGLAQATAAGDALRFEAQGPGTLPTTATFGTTETATGCTIASYTSDDQGVHLGIASTTTTNRLTCKLAAGSRIVARIRGHAVSTGTMGIGGIAVVIGRADGKRIAFGPSSSAAVVSYWTNYDTYSTLRATIAGTYVKDDIWIRAGADGAGNVVVEIGPDGISWQTVYTAADATAWGDAGAVTLVGFGEYTQTNGLVSFATLSRCTITAVA